MTKPQIALLLGGPADGFKMAVPPGHRIVQAAAPLPAEPFASMSNDEIDKNETTVVGNYVIGVLTGAHHEIFHVGLNNASDDPLHMLLDGYRRPPGSPDRAAVVPNMVKILGGPWDGVGVMVKADQRTVKVEHYDGTALAYEHEFHIVPLVGKVGTGLNTYYVAISDPLTDCPIKMLIDGYRQGAAVDEWDEREVCRFCGARVLSPCDAPPTDFCEKALNATYGKRDGRMK